MDSQPIFTVRDVIMLLTMSIGIGGMWMRLETAIARLSTKMEYVEKAVNGGGAPRRRSTTRARRAAGRR